MLRQALAIDPSFAPAAAMIGSCRMHQRAHRLAPVGDAEIAEAVRLAKGAIDAGKDDPDALWMAGWTLSHLGGEPAMGANVIDRALTLNPNCAHAWMARGLVYICQNRPDRAIEALERAIRLSPLDPWGSRVFTSLMALVDRALRLNPSFALGWLVSGALSLWAGQPDRASSTPKPRCV